MKRLESSKVIAGRSYEKGKKRTFFCRHMHTLTDSCLEGSQNIYRICLSHDTILKLAWCLFCSNFIWQMKDEEEVPVLSISSILCARNFNLCGTGRGFRSIYHIMGTHKRHVDRSLVHFRVTQHIWPITQRAILAHAHRVSHRDCIGSVSDSVPPHPLFPLFLASDILGT